MIFEKWGAYGNAGVGQRHWRPTGFTIRWGDE